jgi:uncharacterized protein (TIGR03067 family)
MRIYLTVTLVGFLLAAGWAAGQAGDADKDKKDKAIQDDRKALEGKWKVVAVEIAGKPYPPKMGPGNLEFKGDRFLAFQPGISYRIDPTKKPKHIDLIGMLGKKELITRGIYSLEKGELTLAIPLAQPTQEGEAPRPADFGPGDKEWPIVVFKSKRR